MQLMLSSIKNQYVTNANITCIWTPLALMSCARAFLFWLTFVCMSVRLVFVPRPVNLHDTARDVVGIALCSLEEDTLGVKFSQATICLMVSQGF